MKICYILIVLFLLGGLVYGEEIDINRIIKIESNGDPNAFNKKSGATGLMQITPICLMEWNNKIGMFGTGYRNNHAKTLGQLVIVYDNHYNIGDMYNGGKNIRVGSWYINERIPQMLKAYGIEDSVEARLACYNWGIGNYRKYLKGEKKMPKETRDYIRKYKGGK